MNQTLLSEFGNPIERVERAIAALRQGQGVLVLDDEIVKMKATLFLPQKR